MKKIVWSVVALLGVGITVHARTSAESDSLKVINLQEVQVVSTRATAKTPMAFTNIGKAELKKVNFGQDIPYLLSMTPSYPDHIGMREPVSLHNPPCTRNRWYTHQHHRERDTDE